ncbi:kelch repeat-containing protein [candidate division CSSED10-310 bacterium]|uniref:Kelch repeat-containing protein n=1 Tax=candidate division CSSED10-310 bacterium TaxID=2855610 RepID=A0ABV6Z2B4_UNCC1
MYLFGGKRTEGLFSNELWVYDGSD